MVDRDVALKASSGVLMTAAAAAAAASTPAVAAPADPPPPVPVSTWEGFYLGASVGASWLNSVQDDTAAVNAIFLNGEPGPTTGGAISTANGIGWQGGLNLGYNWQAGNFVYGLEGDFSWLGHTSASSNGSFTNSYTARGYSFFGGTGTAFRSSEVNALGTFRARFGFDFNGTLPYVTFGVAGADIKNTFAVTAIAGSGIASSGSVSLTKWVPGLVLGGGIEHRLSQNLSLRGEVDWIGFQTQRLGNPLFSATYLALNSNHSPVAFTNDVVIARVGLNYRF